jgi:hypothetical protein
LAVGALGAADAAGAEPTDETRSAIAALAIMAVSAVTRLLRMLPPFLSVDLCRATGSGLLSCERWHFGMRGYAFEPAGGSALL